MPPLAKEGKARQISHAGKDMTGIQQCGREMSVHIPLLVKYPRKTLKANFLLIL